MNIVHKNLYEEKWKTMSFSEKMLNIGSEVNRAIKWKNKNNNEQKEKAAYRAIELLYFTIETEYKKHSLKELTRLKEVIADYFLGKNEYNTNDNILKEFDIFYTPFSKIKNK